jgi:hypothetical protein
LTLFLYLIKHSLFIVYMFFYVLKELRQLISDIKLDNVLTINKPLTKTSRVVARGKVWRFPFCTFCIPLVWMEHKYIYIYINRRLSTFRRVKPLSSLFIQCCSWPYICLLYLYNVVHGRIFGFSFYLTASVT